MNVAGFFVWLFLRSLLARYLGGYELMLSEFSLLVGLVVGVLVLNRDRHCRRQGPASDCRRAEPELWPTEKRRPRRHGRYT